MEPRIPKGPPARTKWGDGKIKVGMGIADMDFRNAPCITESLQKRIAHGNWGYTRVADSYIEAITDWNRDRHGIEVDPDSIVISSGVHPGLIAALAKTASPPFVVNVAGPEKLSVRAVCEFFGEAFDREPTFVGEESGSALLSCANRAFAEFGHPRVGARQMMEWVADWVRRGGASHGKPTHFGNRDGRF